MSVPAHYLNTLGRPDYPELSYDNPQPSGVVDLSPEQMIVNLHAIMARLEGIFTSRKVGLRKEISTAAETDGSGNLDMLLYTVPAGMEAMIHRVIVSSNAYSPASPFTAASSGLGLYDAAGGNSNALRDFLSGSGTAAIIPAIYEAEANGGIYLRGNQSLYLNIVGTGTLATKQIMCSCQLIEFQAGGTHLDVS